MSVYKNCTCKQVEREINYYERDEMTDNYVNATKRDSFLCVLHINRPIKFRASSSWNLLHWIA